MSNLLQNFYEKIRASINVSEIVRTKVTLTKKGAEYTGLCPFHSEKTPSFTVNDKKRFYHCFGCGAHGDVIKFESEQTGMSYRDAAYKIADKYSIPVPKFSKEEEIEQQESDKVLKVLSIASDYYVSKLNPEIQDLLLKRGLTHDIIKRYNLGFSGGSGSLMEYFKDKKINISDLQNSGLIVKRSDGKYYEFFSNRIMIPIRSSFGKVIGFGARSIGQEMPKYINSPENLVFKKGESLYGEDIAYSAAHKAGHVILVEGYFDVIGLYQAGFQNVVASLGTAVTQNQLNRLWRMADEVIVCLDGDDAGIRASKKLLDIAIENISSGKNISFIVLPKGYDPDDYVKKFGKDQFSRILSERKNFSEYLFFYLSKTMKYSSPEERAEFEREVYEYAKRIKDQILSRNVQSYFRNELWKLFNRKEKVSQKPKLSTLKSQDPKKNIEDTILGFAMANIDKFTLESYDSLIAKLEINSELTNFITESAFYQNGHYNNDFHEIIKNTSFYEEFEILCAISKSSIPNNIRVSLEEVLDYLFSKRYLITLTEEFKKLVSSSDLSEERIGFYLGEIESTKKNIQNFNTKIDLGER
jgi:DNA primase